MAEVTERTQPARAVSNSAFLAELAVALPQGACMWVTSFAGSPDVTDVRNWYGKPYSAQRMGDRIDHWTEHNTYFSVAALRPSADGEIRRRKACFARLLALVVDDVLLEDVQGQVSYVLQTSPGKTQVGILLDGEDEDCADPQLVDALVTTMAERGLLKADISGNNAVRYVRLPTGQNQKPRASGPFVHQVVQWNPRVRMSLADAAASFGLDLDELRGQIRQPAGQIVAGQQDEKLDELMSNVIRGEGLHDSLNQIAASLVATGMPGGAVVNLLRGLMKNSAAPHDERWLARYQDIPRSVSTAQEKFSRPATAVEPASGLPLLSLQELEAASADVAWAVKGILPADSVGMMFGASGTFKSFLALDMALHIAHGMQWLGKKTTKAPVLYIAAEGGTGLWRRIKAWHLARGLRWDAINFRVLPLPVMLMKDAAKVVEAAQAIGMHPGLIVADTMSQTFDGEENSSNEVAGYLRAIGSAFRALWQCVVLVVHHSGHSATERPRGSSAITANVDFLLGVFRDEAQLLATMTCEKQKDGERFDPVNFELTSHLLGKDKDGDEIRSLAARHLNPGAEFVEALERQAASGRGGRTMQLVQLAHNGMPYKSLRHDFYEALADMKTEAKQKAFIRAWNEAKEQHLLELVDGVILLPSSVDNSPEAKQ